MHKAWRSSGGVYLGGRGVCVCAEFCCRERGQRSGIVVHGHLHSHLALSKTHLMGPLSDTLLLWA